LGIEPCAVEFTVTLSGLGDATSPLDVTACDGDLCTTIQVARGDCVIEGAFGACFFQDSHELLLDRRYVTDDPYFAPDNPEVTLVVTDAHGTVWVDESVRPVEHRTMECGRPCFSRSVER